VSRLATGARAVDSCSGRCQHSQADSEADAGWLSNLYMAEHGYQAGFEQQAFQLLEHADVSFDWSIIEKLEHEAGRPIEE
jgi:hypothetical protein